MGISNQSAEYFARVSGQWDEMRAGYFTEAIRTAAIRKAYLRPEMVVADIGAGTGFMSAGLAPLVRRVYAVDASPQMLAVAMENLAGVSNVHFRLADGLALPLPDQSLDAVFANMYLHHCPDPLAAIRELARVLRPGGRLVLTDMDSHPYEWFKTEMADVWLGFDRAQLQAWLQQAGLVNTFVDCSGESCQAESHGAETPEAARRAHISVFVAAGTRRIPGVKEAVQHDYGAAAQGAAAPESQFCCSPGSAAASSCYAPTGPPAPAASACCPPSLISLDEVSAGPPADPGPGVQFDPSYTPDQTAGVPAEAAEIALGCGNPTAMANLQPGEVVLDIGSGGGLDAFIAARQVGPHGRVIGVDMTPEMLARARAAADKAGLSATVEFRQGQAEAMPVDSAAVDVVISNCVINLCEDKGAVLAEAYRVLKPGGRLEVSDMVTDQAFPLDLLQNPSEWPGCVFGALPEQEYLDLVKQAGFVNVKTRRSASTGAAYGVNVYSLEVEGWKQP